MSKKKILYIHHSGGLGGAPRSLSLLLDCLDLKTYDASLLCIYAGPVLDLFKTKPITLFLRESIYPFHGSTVVPMWNMKILLRNLFGAPISFFFARKFIKAHKPDLIHINSSCLCITAFAAKTVDKNIKIVCHVREPLRNSIFGKIIKFICKRNIDKYISIDKFTGNSMESAWNTKTIYNAVDFSAYNLNIRSNKLREELSLSPKDVVFLFLARVAQGNGAIEFVNVANKLTDIHDNYHFVIAGFNRDVTDSYAKDVRKLAGQNPNLHLMKFREDVVDLIASSDVMVIPFTEPHFARAAIEASALGKPCIGANIGGVQELIIDKETGYLYKDYNDFIKYCEILGSNSLERERMGRNGYSFALNNFDSVKSAKDIFQIYDDLLNNG
jgi:glycosyltransferase involved in cell wall biosynthesis